MGWVNLYPQISSFVAFNRLAGIAQIMEQVGDVFQKKQGEEWGCGESGGLPGLPGLPLLYK